MKSVLKPLFQIILPSVSQYASPIFPVSSSLHPAVVLELPVNGIMCLLGESQLLAPISLSYCGLTSESLPSLFPTTPSISPLTCFFFRASSEVFWAAFRAAGLYTVFVRPMDVENT